MRTKESNLSIILEWDVLEKVYLTEYYIIFTILSKLDNRIIQLNVNTLSSRTIYSKKMNYA